MTECINFKKMTKEERNEIINRWREIGCLCHLKKGSQNEWRCAKSYELMAHFLLNKDNELIKYMSQDKLDILETIAFVIIGRVIATDRPRVNRFVSPEEIIMPFTDVKVRDAIAYIQEKDGEYKKKAPVYRRVSSYYFLDDKTFEEAFVYVNKHIDNEMLIKVFDIDMELWLCSVLSKYLCVKLDKRKK